MQIEVNDKIMNKLIELGFTVQQITENVNAYLLERVRFLVQAKLFALANNQVESEMSKLS